MHPCSTSQGATREDMHRELARLAPLIPRNADERLHTLQERELGAAAEDDAWMGELHPDLRQLQA